MRYLAFVVATAEARERGADEALFVNERCEALECASSNVFAVMGDALVTPPVSAGILPGITRARVVALARADGMRVDERCFSVEAALPGEIFVTSSVRGVAPATRVDGRAVGGGGVGAVTRRICELFRGIAGAGGPAA
jgi:branched-subunit amino acid aminotransferase/4-amino-4-deoxychorismate lyase